MKKHYFFIKGSLYRKVLLCTFLLISGLFLRAQVNTGGTATTANHNKQIIGYITEWDAWKAANAGLPAQGALTHLNIDYSKYTILNFSFFGVAKDGSLHSGDFRNKNIYQPGAVQEPADIFFTDVYSSWDLFLLFGEIEAIQYISQDVANRAKAQGFDVVVNGTTWSNPTWGLYNKPLPLPLHKEGGAPGLLTLAHEKGVKVLASIGGWSMCKHYPEMAADPSKRAKFVADCKKLISIGFDGIDLDWEYPGPYSGMNFTGSQADFTNYTTLIQEIRNAIGTSKLITAAMSADPAKISGFEWSKISKTMNYFNFMTYDFNGGWSIKAGHNAPLNSYDGAEAPTFNWQSLMDKLNSMGVPKSMINFGTPFYGRGVVCQSTAALNAPTLKTSVTLQPDGPVSTCADYTNWPLDVYDGTPNYFFIKQKALGSGSGWTRHWDSQAKVPYLTNGKYFLSYDDEESMGYKAQFIVDNQLAGSIVWTAFGDLEITGAETDFGTKLKRWSTVNSVLVNKLNSVFAIGNTGNLAPTVSISSPTSGTTYSSGANISISASATDADGSIAKVEFFQGSTSLGIDNSSPYTLTWNNVPSGNYTITAVATDNKNLSTTSSAVNVTVNGIINNDKLAVIGYMPSWAGDAANIQYNKLTNIIYAFVIPSASGDGSLGAIDNVAKLQQIVTSAHAAGTKVSIAVGGWSDLNNPGFNTLSASSTGRTNFAKNLLNICNQYNLDGVDIDWEYPEGHASDYSSMMQELATTLHSKGKILTAAVTGSDYYGKNILNSVFNSVDYLNIMAYDGDSGAGHSPYSFAQSSLSYWVGRGLPIKKAVLGVPFYARPSWTTFANLVVAGADPNADFYNGDYYNGLNTIKQKATLAKSYGGIMIWELSGDAVGANSLLSAIYSTLNGGSVNKAPIVNISSPVNNATFTSAASITITANASDTDGSITKVEFYQGNTYLGVANSSPYSFSWNNVATGSYALKAVATDNGNLTTTSSVVNIIVSPAVGNCGNYPVYPQGRGNYKPGDNVLYAGGIYTCKPWPYDGWANSTSPSYEPGVGYVWQDAWIYAGPCNGTITKYPPVVILVNPTNNVTFTTGANITLTASVSDQDGTVSKVSFFQGSTLLGTINNSPYNVIWNNVPVGNYSLTAVATDNDNLTTTSAVVNIVVSPVISTCGGLPVYPSGKGNYKPGDRVSNINNVYECKPWPYDGWANSSNTAYEPGVGYAWQDAWIFISNCVKSAPVVAAEDKNYNSQLYIYPNPANEILNIALIGSEKLDISLVNVAGHVVLNKQVNSDFAKIDISSLPTGIYLVKVNEMNFRKIVKE